MQRTQLIGSVVIGLSFDGVKFGQESRYRLHTSWGDEDLPERRELDLRTDPMAKDFLSRQLQVSPVNINGDALCEDINAVVLG